MLVLTRKKGQAIVIGENIKIVIVSVGGDSVKIGIEAPNDIKILRAELVEAVRDINMVASKKMPQIKVKKEGVKPSQLTNVTIKARRHQG